MAGIICAYQFFFVPLPANSNTYVMNAICRDAEIRFLESKLQSDKAEFIAVYGRRRIGKTYLIRELFSDRFSFAVSGVLNGDKSEQFQAFADALEDYGYKGDKPKNWMAAFRCLQLLLQKKLKGNKPVVVFIDEIPCLDTRNARFIPALDHFWNGWAAYQKQIKLIVCGSATSWIIGNLIDSHGGLHNRLTAELHLRQFTLLDVERYLNKRRFMWQRLEIVQAYMIFGGVPYYLSLLDPSQSLAQNIDRLLFAEDAPLRREYDRVFKSLFASPETYMRIVQLLAENKSGLTRNEISEKLSLNTGGGLSDMLAALENCDFIRCYSIREKKISSRLGLYQLTDFFTLFHYHFLTAHHSDEHFWVNLLDKPKQNTWFGFAFERVVMAHVPQIKKALGIAGMHTEYYSWRSKISEPKAQVDLLIERADKVINLCEIKYSDAQYIITKDEDMRYRNRIAAFKLETGTRCAIHSTFITTYGLQKGMYSSSVQHSLTIDDLFIE